MKRLLLLALSVLLASCTAPTPTPPPTLTLPPTSPPTTPVPITPTNAGSTPSITDTPPADIAWGVQTRTTGCIAPLPLQDKGCTPGNVFPNATVGDGSSHDICVAAYTKTIPDIPLALQNQVYAAYGITSHAPGQYEIDHLVPLELGGNNLPGDTSNLWPEPASPIPGSHEKDTVEIYLHDQVCTGKMSLHAAQVAIATNWVSVYNRIKAP